MTQSSIPVRGPTWLSWSLLTLGTTGFAALWVLLALYTREQLSWMAVVGALDVAWMLRLGRWPRGTGRVLAGLVGTAVIVALANWWIIASHLSAVLGLTPWESASKLGWNHAWTLAQIANGIGDVAWIAAGLVAAAIASR